MHSERLNEKQSFEDIFVELFLTLVNNIAESTLFETTELTELRPRFPSLILVPLMGFASTLLSLLTALLVFINQPLARILTAVNGFILEVSLGLVDLFSRMPLASKRVATPTIPELLLIYGILILAANLKRWKHSLAGLILLAGIYGGLQAPDVVHGERGNEKKEFWRYFC